MHVSTSTLSGEEPLLHRSIYYVFTGYFNGNVLVEVLSPTYH